MKLRRALADALDPTRAAETTALRDQITQLRVDRAVDRIVLAVIRHDHAEVTGLLAARLAESRADVAALLERSAECAACPEEHTTDD